MPVLVLLALAVLGLGVSSVLLVDYLHPLPIFCDAGGGCDIVRQSRFADMLGIQTPALGVLFFIGVLLFALWPARRLLIAWTAGGAAAALGFMAIQLFVLHAVCKYCMIADGSSLLVFVLAIVARKAALPRGRVQVSVGLAAAAAALAPFIYARALPAPPSPALITIGPAPDVIQREQRPGVATIVEFVDFECPYCRRLHATMEAVLHDYGEKVRVVRKQHPLGMIHPHADVAARAACCADEAGKGDAMAEALYQAPPEELTSEGCEKIASQVGLDVERYKQCFASDRPKARLDADAADAKAAGLGNEVPVFWIGETRFRGAQPPEVIKAGIDRALAAR